MKLQPFILFILLPIFSFGQDLSVSGRVLDKEKTPISFVNVLVLTQQDSTIVKGTSTEDNGTFKISALQKGNYIVQYSFIGFKTIYKTIDLNESITLADTILEEDIETLGEISIVAKRPTIRKEADKLVFDIQNTALVEGDMLQVLRSTPGVLVSDSGLSVKSDIPTVYINNRKVQLGSEELIQLLESSSANSIKSIEVITNPSAKYDADTATVINIVMSKNLITGYRGSVFTNYTQGVFPRYNGGMSHFFKNKKISLNLNYNYANSKINRENDDIVNFLDLTNQVDEIWRSDINRNTWSDTHNVDLNFDYFVDDNNTLSLTSTVLYLPNFKYRINNNTVITDESMTFDSSFNANNLSRDKKHNIGIDLGYVHQFKEKGALSFNSHFTTYDYNRSQEVISNYFDENHIFYDATAYNTKANQNTQILTSKIDYVLPINDNSNFEIGAKYSNIRTESDITQFDVDIPSGNEQIDLQNSDAFDYEEDVFSAYSNYSVDTEQWNLSIGLRVEQTDTEGKSISTDQINKQNYLEWFPNASILYTVSDNFNVYINYKRSLTRPSYTHLNPFQFFLNDNTIVTGNPNLSPTFNNHFVLGTTVFENFTIEAYYQNYDGNISNLSRQNNATNIIEYVPVNLDKTVEFGFDFATYFDVVESWSVYFVTSFYNIEEETNFEEGFVKQDQWSNYSILQNDFSFLKDKSMSLNLTLTWVGKNLQGLKVVEDRLDSQLAISKTILKKKGVISLAISDLFNMQDAEVYSQYLNQYSTSYRNADNRYIKLGFRYKFGNTKLETNARSSEQEERDRLKDLN
ncbi:glucosamine-6-phosphate deaminase [Flavobacteriales bacterium 33_180_T64]|nr:glucosamine-6-phosphate deaminase [Flavobacteriales bacterium 33_180_T64]